MSRRDSYLVKKIKKLERLAKGAEANSFGTAWVPSNSAEGYMAETVDHIQEVLYEAFIRYDEKKAQEKFDEEREKWEEHNKRPEPTYSPNGIIWNDLPWKRHPAHEEGHRYHVLRWSGSIDWKTFRYRSMKKCSEKNCIINAPVETQEKFARMPK